MSRLDEIEARLRAATEGPWAYYETNRQVEAPDDDLVLAQTRNKHDEDFPNAHANGALIAHIPTDLPALVAVAKLAKLLVDWIDWRDGFNADAADYPMGRRGEPIDGMRKALAALDREEG